MSVHTHVHTYVADIFHMIACPSSLCGSIRVRRSREGLHLEVNFSQFLLKKWRSSYCWGKNIYLRGSHQREALREQVRKSHVLLRRISNSLYFTLAVPCYYRQEVVYPSLNMPTECVILWTKSCIRINGDQTQSLGQKFPEQIRTMSILQKIMWFSFELVSHVGFEQAIEQLLYTVSQSPLAVFRPTQKTRKTCRDGATHETKSRTLMSRIYRHGN